MKRFRLIKHDLIFKTPGGTSRGILKTKPTHFLILEEGDKIGVGEVSRIPKLSVDAIEDFDEQAHIALKAYTANQTPIPASLPSLRFAVEVAEIHLASSSVANLFNAHDFTEGNSGIPINGLIWMGDKSYMLKQIEEKLAAGFGCLKMKIGAIDFNTEFEILKSIRSAFSARDLVLRVDANGAFSPQEAMEKLEQLASLEIHSIEQPIAVLQHEAMAELCLSSPIPIALDEELIGVEPNQQLLSAIKPQYLIFKPSLLGGFAVVEDWIALCNKENIQWWGTSALESNIGLNAIAQWTATKNNSLYQGLGTGQLFTNNIDSPLFIEKGELKYSPAKKWDFPYADIQ